MPRGTDRYDEARLQGRLWTPRLLGSRLSAWYSADGPFAGASGVVSQWNDISGNNNHATKSATQQPSFEDTSWRFSPIRSLGFFSTEKFLSFATAFTYTAANGMCAAVLCEHSTSTAALAILAGNAVGVPELRLSNHNVELLSRSTASLATGGAAVQNSANVIGFEASTNNSVVFCNGTRTATSNNPGFTNTLPFIGTAGGGEIWDSRVAEIVIGNNVLWTTQERQLIDGYLAWKGGAQNNLAASHPYKNRPPLIGV